MWRKILHTIEEHGLLAGCGGVMAAVSGGSDSVAMLYILNHLRRRLGYRLCVGHLDHRIRGREAETDADFVRRLSWKMGLPVVVGRMDVPRMAARKGISLEMAARTARYAFLKEAAVEMACDCVAVGHTADDQVETILLHFVRGAAPDGLGGMDYRTRLEGLNVVRPLLDVTRGELAVFLKAHHLDWREDASNQDPAHLRNRVRHELLPLLESRFNPRVRKAVLRMAELIRDDAEVLWLQADKELQECRVGDTFELRTDRLKVLLPAVRRRVIVGWLREAFGGGSNIDRNTVAAVERLALKGSGTHLLNVSGARVIECSYGRLRILARGDVGGDQRPFRVRLPLPGSVRIAEAGVEISASRADNGDGCPGSDHRGRRLFLWDKVEIDAARVGRAGVYVRSRLPGDRMRPLGMQGSRKLQDILVDLKVPRSKRGRLPLFECRGEIIWFPGYRPASGWKAREGEAAWRICVWVERG